MGNLIDQAKNRQLLAERGKWPQGALEACQEIEQRFPDWYAWWTPKGWRTDGDVPDGPCYGASPINNAVAGRSLYGVTPAELAEQIHECEEERAALRRYHRPPWDL